MDEKVILLSPKNFLKKMKIYKHILNSDYLFSSPNSRLKLFDYVKKEIREEFKNNER